MHFICELLKMKSIYNRFFKCFVICLTVCFVGLSIYPSYLTVRFSHPKPLPKRIRSCKEKMQSFKKTLLVLVFNFPFYNNIPYLRQMYGGVFGRLVMCGPPVANNIRYKPDIGMYIEDGYFGYHCAAKAIEENPGFEGYMYGNDDMIINWFNLLHRDKQKIWQGPKDVDFRQAAYGNITVPWYWWTTDMGIKACQSYHQDLSNLGKIYILETLLIKNGAGKPRCGKGWSDFFYIPGKFSSDFVLLSNIAYKRRLFLEIAVTVILRSLDEYKNFEILSGVFLPDINVPADDPKAFWRSYNRNLTFIHPYKMNVGDKEYNMEQLSTRVIRYTMVLLNWTNC